jgi:hypothetical protein
MPPCRTGNALGAQSIEDRICGRDTKALAAPWGPLPTGSTRATGPRPRLAGSRYFSGTLRRAPCQTPGMSRALVTLYLGTYLRTTREEKCSPGRDICRR